MTAEGIADITALGRPISHGDSPGSRIRVSTLDILGDLTTIKPPERNLGIIPKHSENATASGIEWTASTSLEIGNSTTGVIAARTHTLKTEGVPEVTLGLRAAFVCVPRTSVGVQLAIYAGTGMESVLVCCSLVHVLDDIDLMGWVGCR